MSDHLWTPSGSVLPSDVRQAQEAIEAYSPNLELGLDKRNEQWVVLWKHGPGGAPYPVLGLGFTLPGYEEIQRRLYMADTQRHGGKIVDEVQKRQTRAKLSRDAKTHEAAIETAEHLEHAFHRLGKTSYRRVYIPKGVKV